MTLFEQEILFGLRLQDILNFAIFFIILFSLIYSLVTRNQKNDDII
jgi:hypothetical protein